MTKRRWPIVLVLASASTFVVLQACDSGPDAQPRQNGCIGTACFETGAPGEGGPLPESSPPTDGDSDGPVVYGDPLAGTSKQGSLIKGAYQFVEGPVWVVDKLVFSDTNANTLFQVSSAGVITTLRGPGGFGPNGNAVDQQGRLYTCEANRGRVTRTDATLANPVDVSGTYMGKQYNAPNDVIVRSDGTMYFTDPFYGGTIPDGGLPQDDYAVYRVPSGGAASRLAFDFNKPNGIALSPDGNTIYVVDNGVGQVLQANLKADGTLNGTFTKIVDAAGGDGMAVDLAGNLYVAATGGIKVFDKAGQSLGTITLAAGNPSNCTFGGPDKQTLFITSNAGGGNAATGLYSIHLNVPGLP